MLFRTAGRRFEVDTDAGVYLFCPLFGEMFARKEPPAQATTQAQAATQAHSGPLDYWREGTVYNLRLGRLEVTWEPWSVVKARMREEAERRAAYHRELEAEAETA